MIAYKEKSNNEIESIDKFSIQGIPFSWKDSTSKNEYLTIQSIPKTNNEID